MPKPRRKYGPKQRVPNEIMKKLEAALSSARMERASFGRPGGSDISVDGGPKQSADDYIKDETRLYRHSYIEYPLEVVIRWAKGADSKLAEFSEAP